MNIRKSNKGVTLVELVVSLAILAILMVAVIMVMSSNTIIFKKTKADIQVHESAQESYNVIYDALIQAKTIEAEGYIQNVAGTATDAIQFVANDKGRIISESGISECTLKKLQDGDTSVTEFDTLYSFDDGTGVTSYKTVYLTKLVIEYAVPYEAVYATDDTLAPTGTDKDTCTATFTFDEGDMKVQYTHQYMDKLDTPEEVFTSQLNYVKAGTKDISGATAKFDALNDCVQVDLFFADKNMKYDSKGMVKLRNSFVIQKSKDEIED